MFSIFHKNIIKGGSIFKIITQKEFIRYSWWYYGCDDDIQPISNGGRGLVIDSEYNIIAIIFCNGNDGSYIVYDWKEMSKDIEDSLNNYKHQQSHKDITDPP